MNAADWAGALAGMPGAVKLMAVLAGLFAVAAVTAWWAGRGPESDVDGTPVDEQDSGPRFFRSTATYTTWRVHPDGAVEVRSDPTAPWSPAGTTLHDLITGREFVEAEQVDCESRPGGEFRA